RARNYYLKSLDLYRNLQNSQKQAELLKHLGDVSWLRQNENAAVDYYNQALEIAKEVNNKGLLMEIYGDLSKVYEKRGVVTKAFEFYKMSEAYRDSIA